MLERFQNSSEVEKYVKGEYVHTHIAREADFARSERFEQVQGF